MERKLLAILIPTYNRVDSLMINLEMLEDYFEKLECYQDVKVIISDNYSIDKTFEFVEKHISNKVTDYEIFKQDQNIGLEKNAIFCLEQSDAEYSMYLGDDDYLDFGYLKRVLEYLLDNEITCIIPNYYNINNDFEKTGKLRDVIEEDKIYSKEGNKLELMFKAHQLSGVTIKTKDTLNSYIERKGNNIYLFMYLAAFNIRRGKTVHITEYPVRVTSTNSKDWGYGDDGLITEVLQNIDMIAETENEKFKLEKYYLLNNKRYLWYLKRPIPFLKKIFNSSRYSNKLRLFILYRMTLDGSLLLIKKVIKLILRALGYKVNNKKTAKI